MYWIVVADSRTETLQTAGQILCKQGMRVTGFKSGQALLGFLKGNRPDLILLGDVMGELGGVAAAEALRQAVQPGEEIPLLLLADAEGAGDAAAQAAAQAAAMGARGVLGLPLMAGPLTGYVRGVLSAGGQSGGKSAAAGSNLEEIVAALEACNDSTHGMWMGKEAFGNFYRNMLRYLGRYHGLAFQVLFTVEMPSDFDSETQAKVMADFRQQIQRSLRGNDIMLESGANQLFLLLPELQTSDIAPVISKIVEEWKRSAYGPVTEIASEVRRARLSGFDEAEGAKKQADWVVVVDDDVTNLKMAGHILSREHMRVTALRSGRALLEYVRSNKPDLILLDIRMPDLDGFETMRLLRQEPAPAREIPVIFLSADENAETETRGLELGAMDFIRKPFVPDVLTLRVRHIIELDRLQKNLTLETELKTQENERLSLHLVQTLAEAIDAKDAYTNGHSGRVAAYAREIARRYGYTRQQQDEIYMIGLLHDVGKIGVPDKVITKPGKLTAEEYEQVKTHAVMGARILRNIQERPKLAIGARWHHERYDGTGYPDGLSGDAIPEEARIIAVADAYDAMTSRRSYHDIFPQAEVRREFVEGSGTQFDPVFTDIMLQIIEEDTEYRLRED